MRAVGARRTEPAGFRPLALEFEKGKQNETEPHGGGESGGASKWPGAPYSLPDPDSRPKCPQASSPCLQGSSPASHRHPTPLPHREVIFLITFSVSDL